ncbi:hypothetical protein CDAR_127671 [Caerostris darwini]|uniref:Uncharacterized protein n=1 Tax=Caerostris darwini TaxID=1538125 RepID=A0AAV4Q9N4_9ARAC|nr:hypothetical protein CDAR_127671 [Caerostris darwini]
MLKTYYAYEWQLKIETIPLFSMGLRSREAKRHRRHPIIYIQYKKEKKEIYSTSYYCFKIAVFSGGIYTEEKNGTTLAFRKMLSLCIVKAGPYSLQNLPSHVSPECA